MGRKATGIASDFSKEVIDAVQEAINRSGMSNAEVIKQAGISQDYYYTRARYERPFNTNDVDRIAEVIGVDPYSIFDEASAKLGEVEDRKRITMSKLAKRLGLAAYLDENKEAERDADPDAGA